MVSGFLCPVSVGTGDRQGNPGPECPSWPCPWNWDCCLGCLPTEVLALRIIPPFPVQPVFLFSASLQDLPPHPLQYYPLPNGSGKHIPHSFLGLRPMKWWQLFKNAGFVRVCVCVCLPALLAWSRGWGAPPNGHCFEGCWESWGLRPKREQQHVASLP